MLLLEIVFYTFCIAIAVQLFFYTIIFSKFAFLKPQKSNKKLLPVSVIICAKNEATNLKKFLPAILNQNYPSYEIVLINDASADNTLEVMKQFANSHSNIKIVNVKNIEAFWGNKKYALTLGIKAAKNEHLIFTDADCMPASKNWLQEITATFTPQTKVVLGYGAYQKIKHSFLNKLIRFETLLTALQYFSYTKAGIPYMGVGRNLAYQKTLFFKNKGFIKHMHVRSGDDDLFINQVATNKNTAICFSKKSFTISIPKKKWRSWLRQKRRHISTAKYYKPKHKLLLTSFYMSQLVFFTTSFILLSNLYNWQIVVTLCGIRILLFYIIFGKTARKLNETDLLFHLLFLEFFLIGTQLVIFLNNILKKPSFWK